MKIAFICGSIEPGYDGVGDYTRNIAAELIRQGHKIAIVSIADKFVKENCSGDQYIGNIKIPVLRLSSALARKKPAEDAVDWIDNFNPDWLSLQFVPFSFHSKGLPFGLSKFLKQLSQHAKWHIMFHELWVGMDTKASLKLFLWGKGQKLMIRSLIKRLNPSIINTQTNLYQKQLSKLGLSVNYLPLFSNIHKDEKAPDLEKHLNNVVSFVLFGHIHPGTPVLQFATEASSYSRITGKRVKLTLIGRNGSEQANWTSTWINKGLEVEVLGEQSPEKISSVLASATFGIITTPLALVDKSGTFAAMKDHGLSVMCVARDWQPQGFTHYSPIFELPVYKKGGLHALVTSKFQVPEVKSVFDVTQLFINALSEFC